MGERTLTKEQELLQASRSSEDLKAFINCIQNDEEYQAWKAEHPDRDSDWESMTREQKNECLADLIMQLAEEEQQRQYEQLRKVFRKQNILTGEVWDTIRNYCTREKQDPLYSEMLLLLDMFQYGRICGIRQERARRKSAAEAEGGRRM